MRINFLTDNAVKFWNLNDNQTQQHVSFKIIRHY